MLYQKPKKPFVEICKEFDKEFYQPNRNDDKLYRYMWNIYYMLACKAKYFKKYEEYDDFASYAATTIYMRFIKKQKSGERIKSILNYAKKSLYPLKVMFQNETFNQIIDPEYDGINSAILEDNIKTSINSDYTYGMDYDIEELFTRIPIFIRKILNDTPYKNDKITYRRLYISCLLSLISSLTLNKDDLERISKKESGSKLSDELITKIYLHNKYNSTIVWKLPDSFTNYVGVLVTRIRDDIGNEFKETKDHYVLQEDVLDSIILSAYSKDDDEEDLSDYA